MTICATVGGTGTLIGDPPNIVIGMKLKVGFEKFFFVNLPIVMFALLPAASGLLYYRFKDKLCIGDERPVLDMEQLAQENRIRNEPMLAKLSGVLFAVLLAFLLSPIHKIEPSWFTVMAMFVCALTFDHHHMGKWLEKVEWDTLFFFALLFVLVESLSELGVIRTLGNAIMAFIKVFPPDIRMNFAVTIILWVSGIGSAFLESLPYTATMVYIIQDLLGTEVEGVQVIRLLWPLSIGACVGGIGSIMGSSANLVCMAISGRNAENDEDKVMGKDFILYGFPVLLVLLFISNIWLLFLLVWVDFEP
jgi:Na+/H+ antiporter NhaD/arsenite permease-like protein